MTAARSIIDSEDSLPASSSTNSILVGSEDEEVALCVKSGLKLSSRMAGISMALSSPGNEVCVSDNECAESVGIVESNGLGTKILYTGSDPL